MAPQPPPLPPPDPALPLLHAALDAGSAAALLGRALGVDVGQVEPDYVKYRPGRACLIRYRLSLRGAPATVAHVILSSPRGAEKLWTRGGRPAGGAHLPDLGLIALPFPADLRLPALAAVMESGEPPPEVVRYKPERRAVLRFGTGYGKLRSDLRGHGIVAVGRALRAAGVPTPEPLGYLPETRMMLHAAGEGTRLRELRGTPAYRDAMEPAVEALVRLHRAPALAGPPPSPEVEAAELAGAAAIAGALLPDIRPLAERLAERITGELAAVRTGPPVNCHGSFHDDQVLVSAAGGSLLDLDSAALGDPLADVGHFASYLAADGDEPARELFLDAYARHGGRDPRGALIHEAASLLRWATLPFRELEPGWPEAVERRVRVAEVRLREWAGGRRPGDALRAP